MAFEPMSCVSFCCPFHCYPKGLYFVD
uniref:Uncharacterized protein n=1 Tax=Arundo donax TaxID=35708 RepID=A0A0A9A289_ARUDO